MKYKLLIVFILASSFAVSQNKYDLLIQEAIKNEQVNNKRGAFSLYTKALEMNPNGYEALVSSARFNLNEAATQQKKEDRDYMFNYGLNLLERAATIDTSKQTFLYLLILDGYNKNLRLNYQRVYSKDEILSFFDQVSNIYTKSQKRYDFKEYDSFEQIYEMIIEKKNKYIIYSQDK